MNPKRATIWVVSETDFEIKLLVITSGKKGDNADILKLQANFIWLFFFNNLRKRTSYTPPQNFWMNLYIIQKHYCTHLLSSEYNHNHHVYIKADTLAYSFHELGDEASFVGIATILPELRLLITDIRLCSYQGTWQATRMSQSLLAAWILLQCELYAVWRYRPWRSACQPMDDYRNGIISVPVMKCNVSMLSDTNATIHGAQFSDETTLLRKTLQPPLANTLCVNRHDPNCKPILIEHDFIDQCLVTHLIKAYLYSYSLQHSQF